MAITADTARFLTVSSATPEGIMGRADEAIRSAAAEGLAHCELRAANMTAEVRMEVTEALTRNGFYVRHINTGTFFIDWSQPTTKSR